MKRGQLNNILLWVVLLASVIILFVVINNVFSWLFEQDPEETSCVAQVMASQTISELSQGDHALNIECPSRKIVLPPAPGNDTNRALAEEMRKCWDTWGRGENTLFEEDGIYCHICSFITFEEPGMLPDFGQFLANEVFDETDVSYMAYFQPGYSGTQFQGMEQKVQTGSIDKSRAYAAIYYHIRGEEQFDAYFMSISKDSLERPLAAGGGFLIGGAFGGALTGGMAAVALGCGALTGGVCWLVGGAVALGVVGVGVPVAMVADYFANSPPEHAAFIVFRQLDFENVKNLGCEYSFASRG